MFYFLKAKYATYVSKRAAFVINKDYKTECCSLCGGTFVNYAEPLTIEIYGDLCDFYAPDNSLIISERFLKILHDYNAVGYEVKKAKVNSWNKSIDTKTLNSLKYYELVIKSNCGLIRNLNGEELKHCSKCGRRLPFSGIKTEGVSFVPELYDGSDVFSFSNWANMPIVSESLKKTLMKNKLLNLKFININEQVFDERRASDILAEYKNKKI